jgi:DNA-binding PadR family transcriptional regulator
MTAAPLPDLTLTEWAVLAVVAEQAAHGFAISKALAPDGDLGQIWTVPRPIVYRTLAGLEHLGLIEALATEPGDRGPRRTRLQVTPAGEAAVDTWLATPAPHVRDLRTRLLLQFRLLDRRGRDLVPLAASQLERMAPIVAALRAQADDTTEGFNALLARWRLETAEAAARVLESLVYPG